MKSVSAGWSYLHCQRFYPVFFPACILRWMGFLLQDWWIQMRYLRSISQCQWSFLRRQSEWCLAALCFAFLNPLWYFLGSDQALLHYCREYMIPVLITLPFAVFGMVFQLSFITVGKAGFGAALSVMGGVLNIVLDWLFIAIFHWWLAGGAVVDFFAKNNAQVETIALYGFRIVATSFLMMAYNVFASGWFTALNDGKTSAILSFCRTVIFMIAPVLILPGIFGMDGVWMSITAGEVLSILMSIFYFRKYRNMWSVKV